MTITISKAKLIATIAIVALLIPAGAYATHSWPDVDDGRFYTDAVEWAKGNGMTTGCDGGANFCPDRNVTRGENITFAKRYDDLVVQPALTTINADISDLTEGKISHGTIVLTHGTDQIIGNGGVPPSFVINWVGGTEVSGDGPAQMAVHGPVILGGVEYGLRSIEYCIGVNTGAAFIDTVQIWDNQHDLSVIVGDVVDDTDRTADGCYVLDVNLSGAQGYGLLWVVAGGDSLRIRGVQSTWEPLSEGGFTALATSTTAGGGTSPFAGN